MDTKWHQTARILLNLIGWVLRGGYLVGWVPRGARRGARSGARMPQGRGLGREANRIRDRVGIGEGGRWATQLSLKGVQLHLDVAERVQGVGIGRGDGIQGLEGRGQLMERVQHTRHHGEGATHTHTHTPWGGCNTHITHRYRYRYR